MPIDHVGFQFFVLDKGADVSKRPEDGVYIKVCPLLSITYVVVRFYYFSLLRTFLLYVSLQFWCVCVCLLVGGVIVSVYKQQFLFS